ncbi:MAG TPA: hypothetical protein VK791_04405 [bacterium]|nr:hypothetical protein [bacterium]
MKGGFIPTYKIVHFVAQGIDVVIFPVTGSFVYKTKEDQDATIRLFQAKSKAAGFKGNVAVVWDGEGGKMNFIAPPNQKAFFENVTSTFIEANLNKSISW